MLSTLHSRDHLGESMKKTLLSAAILLSTTTLTKIEATESTVITPTGESFSVTHTSTIAGNCAFDAIGKSRIEVVSALTAYIEEHHLAHSTFDTSRTLLHKQILQLGPNTQVEDISTTLANVEDFINSAASMYSTDPSARTPSVLASEALTDFRIKTTATKSEFKDAQSMLQSRILNMYYEKYEAFQVALKEELISSGINDSKLTSEPALIKAVSDVFSKNNGKKSWLPMGLVVGINDKLNLNLSVWSSKNEPTGKVRLYQTSTVDTESPMIHVVWNGNHYDVLTPKAN